MTPARPRPTDGAEKKPNAPRQKKTAEAKPAPSPRRLGVEGSAVRQQFVDAAFDILRIDGYPSISARNIAARAGLKTQLLYYYFRTMDDVLLAVVQQINQRRQLRFEEALASPEPLRALWAMNSDPSSATVSAELTSIASHRETIRSEIVRSARHFRAQQMSAATALIEARASGAVPAAGLTMLAVALSRLIISESSLGLTEGHQEALALVHGMLDQLEPKTTD